MNPWLIALLIVMTVYIAWQYSKTAADPDWAMFNLAAFTGSWYGRDWADCKTPAIHIWYWILAKISKTSVPVVKFMNHLVIGLVGPAIYAVTGEFIPALIYTVMINSGWLWAFHGNVSQLPAALLFIALATDAGPGAMSSLLILTVMVEPKLLPTAIAMLIINQVPALTAIGVLGIIGATCLIIVGFISIKANITVGQLLAWIWEGSVTIPIRMSKNRKGLYTWMPWWTAKAMLYILPLIMLAVWNKPSLAYWIPPITYFLVILTGQVIRQNHLLPLVPWIACSGIPLEFAIGMTLVDWTSAGFYLGDIWTRFYRVFGDHIKAAKATGEYLKNITGSIWVNGMHSEIYIYSRKPVPYGLAEQIEIREVAHERRKLMKERWNKNPADIVVQTESANVTFTSAGYDIIGNNGYNKIWRKRV